jgi:4-amino-4-deoxy-L-arabinose transferase-like glycosyltransferase
MNDPNRTTALASQRNAVAAGIAVLPAAVCLVAYLLFFRGLGDTDLWASHEARAAQDAQRILEDGDWALPRLFDEQVELQKPPLFYWLVAAVGWARGGTVDAVAVRLPAALAGVGTVIVICCFLISQGRPVAALLTGLLLATAQHFTAISRIGRIDVPLTFAVTCSIVGLWTARQAGSFAARSLTWTFIGYLGMAAGVLLKGPIGLVMPLAVLLAAAVFNRETIQVRRLLWGVLLVATVTAPWFALAHLRTSGEFTRQFLWYHNFQRATGGTTTLAVHPWWFYAPRLAFDFLPWSPLLLVAAWISIRNYAANVDPVGRLGLTWFSIILLLLSLSRFKRADYLLPAYPGAALWLGCIGERLYQRWRCQARLTWLTLGVSAALAAITIGWTIRIDVFGPRQDVQHGERYFAAAVRAIAPQPQLILLFREENHLLAYHLGRPLNTFLEWENLEIWTGQPGPHFVLMPAECADQWHQYITSGTLEEVLRYTDRTDRRRPRDIVLMRTRRGIENLHDGSADRSTARQQGTDQRAVAGLQSGGRTGRDR